MSDVHWALIVATLVLTVIGWWLESRQPPEEKAWVALNVGPPSLRRAVNEILAAFQRR